MDRDTSFSEILNKTGQTDKNTDHTYGWVYDLWFEPYRDKGLSILEVGCAHFGGGSLLSLATYFKHSYIRGLDIDWTPIATEVLGHPRIGRLEGDAYDDNEIRGRYDIIIDDCLHDFGHQRKLLYKLLPQLNAGGFYVIEDCQSCDWCPRLSELWGQGLRTMFIDMRSEHQPDNALLRISAPEVTASS
jgi:hypothetical protein